MPRSTHVAIAVDTNVVVRLLTGDDPDQAARAKNLFESAAIWLPKTVILETEWVLRRLYGLNRDRVAEALTALIALPKVLCEDEGAIVAALDWATKGLDFADALHLASAGSARRFATFDRDLAKRARDVSANITVTAL